MISLVNYWIVKLIYIKMQIFLLDINYKYYLKLVNYQILKKFKVVFFIVNVIFYNFFWCFIGFFMLFEWEGLDLIFNDESLFVLNIIFLLS